MNLSQFTTVQAYEVKYTILGKEGKKPIEKNWTFLVSYVDDVKSQILEALKSMALPDVPKT